ADAFGLPEPATGSSRAECGSTAEVPLRTRCKRATRMLTHKPVLTQEADQLNQYQELAAQLARRQRVWLVTGAAGTIGSNLVEALLRLNQRVIGLDNFSTGSERNLAEVRTLLGTARWKSYSHIQGDTRDPETCKQATAGVDFVLHQAALGS